MNVWAITERDNPIKFVFHNSDRYGDRSFDNPEKQNQMANSLNKYVVNKAYELYGCCSSIEKPIPKDTFRFKLCLI